MALLAGLTVAQAGFSSAEENAPRLIPFAPSRSLQPTDAESSSSLKRIWKETSSRAFSKTTVASSVADASQVKSLRWRPRRSKTTPTINPVRVQNNSGVVRQAAQLAEIDPLNDPFGDRSESNLELHSHGFRAPHKIFSTANQEEGAAEALPAPGAEPAAKAPYRPEPLPPEALYNERDCEEGLGKCRKSRELFHNILITNISLNIVPSFRSSDIVEGLDAPQTSKEEHLSRLTSREFHGADGQLLATGRLSDYKHGHVYIGQADGELAKLPIGELSEGDLCYVNSIWGLPAECVLGGSEYEVRNWTLSTFTWSASALCHKPLYFEEVQLERYGHTLGPIVQPWFSGAHFFANIAILPYKAGINPPTECRYALGYYRPGNCAPWLLPPIPLSIRGGLMQAGAVVGAVALIP